MSETTELNFYGESLILHTASNFSALKQFIAKEYSLDPVDVNELKMYYINENDRMSIVNELDYQQALFFNNKESSKNPNFIFKLFLEVDEKSKLYQREMLSSMVEVPAEFSNGSKIKSEYEILKREIEEKEKALKELEQKEQMEKIMKKKMEEESRKQRELEERLRLEFEESLRLEQEEKLRLLKEKEEKERQIKLEEEARLEKERKEKEREVLIQSISLQVVDSVNKNLEKIKQEIIEKTIAETIKSMSLNKDQPSEKVVHRQFSCNECKAFPIVGLRYRCTVCFDYDLCESCEAKTGDAHKHPLIKHREPVAFGNCHRNRGPRCPYMQRKQEEQKTTIESKESPKGDSPTKSVKESVQQEPLKESVPQNQPEDKITNFFENILSLPKKFNEHYQFKRMIPQMRREYDLSNFSDRELKKALKDANGDIEQAISLLFRYL